MSARWPQEPIKVEPKHRKLNFENDPVQIVSVYYGLPREAVVREHQELPEHDTFVTAADGAKLAVLGWGWHTRML